MNRVILAVCLALLVLSGSAMAETRYTMTDLAPIDGYQHSKAWGISDTGYVAGEMYQDPAMYDARAFRWRNGTGMENLGNLSEGCDSWGYDVNDSGTVVGAGTDYGGVQRAVVYAGSGPLYHLGTSTGWAMGVNNDDMVVGRHDSLPVDFFSGTDLDSFGGMAYDINDSHRVVGNVIFEAIGPDYERGRLWDIGASSYTWKPLNPASGYYESRANGINEDGDRAAGRSWNTYGSSQATAWNEQYPGGPWSSSALPYLDADNDEHSFAAEVNNDGTIVGSSGTDGYIFTQSACLWEETAPGNYDVYDLNDLIDDWTGWRLAEARDINESGQIVGTMVRGAEGSAEYRAFLLTPVPEPATSAMLASLALLGVASLIRRRMSLC